MLLIDLLNHGVLNFEHIEIARTTVKPDGNLKFVELIQECNGSFKLDFVGVQASTVSASGHVRILLGDLLEHGV